LPHGGECSLDFRGSCDGSGAFCQRQITAGRAVDDRDNGNDKLRRPTRGGGGTSAADGNTFAIAADGNIYCHYFATIPAGRDAAINWSRATPERDAAEFLVK
jgi:hypothetical protein